MASAGISTGVQAALKDLPSLLFDNNDELKRSGKCALVIDSTQQASTFLRYQAVNYLTAIHSEEMSPDRIRLAVMGGLRHGRAVVLDLMDADVFGACQVRFDELLHGLLDSVRDGSIRKQEKFAPLIRESDGPEYEVDMFTPCNLEKFHLIVLTTKAKPAEELLNSMYVIRVN